MHSANFTALSRAVSFLVPPAPELLAVPELPALPGSEDAFEPQPAPITLIRATIAQAASGRSVLFMVAPWCVLRVRLPMPRGTSPPSPGTPECSGHPSLRQRGFESCR